MKDDTCKYCGNTIRIRADVSTNCGGCIYDSEELDCGCDNPEFVAYKCGLCGKISVACGSMEKK